MTFKAKSLILLLLLFINCSFTVDTKEIVGSWYFVDYADKPYSKKELLELEKEIKNSPESWLKNFNYRFTNHKTYEYKIYGELTNKGIYAIKQDDLILLFDKIKSKKDTFKLEYLDDKFLQMKNRRNKRTSIYYKSEYKFPKVEVIVTE